VPKPFDIADRVDQAEVEITAAREAASEPENALVHAVLAVAFATLAVAEGSK
jgi:hypothetical protein